MHLNETYKVWVSKHFYNTFPVQNHLQKGDALLPFCFKLCFTTHHYEAPSTQGSTETEYTVLVSGLQGVFKKRPNFCYKDFIAHFTTF
jgi:hypothetical protein